MGDYNGVPLYDDTKEPFCQALKISALSGLGQVISALCFNLVRFYACGLVAHVELVLNIVLKTPHQQTKPKK